MARSAAQFRRRQPKAAGPQRRSKLTGEDLELLAYKMRAAYKWQSDPKPFQLAGVQAQLEGVDVVIQASTGAGKTAIAAGPYLWPSSAGKSTIMVCPLLSLEEEMVQTFDLEFGLKAVAVNSKNGACSPSTIKQRILAAEYQIILISPEMLQSRVFINRVLRNARFPRRVLSVVIDEAHCVSHWGADFRKKYGTLGIVRAFLPRGTSMIAFSATLSPRVRRDLMSKLNFPKGGDHFLNVGNDRSNVSIVVRACEHPLNSYADTDFIIPPSVRHTTDVLKTYIYADNIHVGTQIIDHLRARLISTSSLTLEEATAAIRPFNATMSHTYRTESMSQFRAGVIRILVCTDAAGMASLAIGCNIPDVDLVVQWKLPATLSNFIQRAGRAARSPSRTGLAVLLVERSAFSPPDPSSTRPRFNLRKAVRSSAVQLSSSTTKTTKKIKKNYAEAHGLLRGNSSELKDAVPSGVQPALSLDAIDEGLSVFVQSVECRRKVWALQIFDNHYPTDPSVDCCDICVPALLNRCRPGAKPRTTTVKAVKKGQVATEFSGKLEEWRAAVYERDHSGSQWDSTAILDTSHIDLLTSVGRLDNDKLAAILQGSWLWWHEYGTELARLVFPWNIPFIPIPRKKAQPGSSKASKRPAGLTAAGQAKSKRARQGGECWHEYQRQLSNY
ncbi:P-loop containing nucleoside triphosphate hydrolase protein [Lenzites betulinus]|nr:P-loop containing nucleoside triphosphate hydrolase protein [Lenzites betulinus]